MLKRNEYQILAMASLPALVIFIIFSILYDTPLIFDDYRYLHASLNENFKFADIDKFISRSPFFAVLLYILLRLDFLQSTFWFFLNLFFTFHVLTVGLVIIYLIKSLGIGEYLQEKKYKLLVAASILSLSFYPHFLELIMWPSAAPFFVGGFLMALGLFTRSYYLKAFLFLCSYATYETFILPSVILAAIPAIVDLSSNAILKFELKKILKEAGVFVAALAGFFLLKWLLAELYSPFNQSMEMPTVENFKRMLFYFYETDFHTTLWENRIELILLFIMVIVLAVKNPKNIAWILILLAAMIMSGIQDIVIPYPGYRIIYGSFLIRGGIIAVGIYLISRYITPYVGLVFALGFFVVYLPSSYRTWTIRTYDAKVLDKNVERIENIYKNSNGGATIIIGDFIDGMRPYDWVAPPKSRTILDLFVNRINIDKPLDLVFTGDSVIKNFPIVYPACYMHKGSGIAVPDKEALTGEAIYAGPREGESVMIFGPYVSLDSGTYTIDFRLKRGGFPKSNEEIAYIDVVSNLGNNLIGAKLLKTEDFNSNSYQSFSIDFKLNEKHKNVEMRVAHKKDAWLFVDGITIQKNNVMLPK